MNLTERDESLVAVLRALPVTERESALERACVADPTLRDRRSHIIAALAKTTDASPAESVGLTSPRSMMLAFESALEVTPTEASGSRIGNYHLLEKIGEGGFGVVWMAEQEQPIHRRVALKIIKLGMDTEEVIARFEAERQTLALMEHPNIARVFDAGATDAGRPYFVMELVSGLPITHFCDVRRLPAEERLRLFILVCKAVQHAHQKGIIHRDLKPSNILVALHDGVPVPKIIDFGIAKATGLSLTNKTFITQFHAFVGTPAYTSPEQLVMSGSDVDTRSDIYSLGVLLYELLCGRLPFDANSIEQSGLDAMRRTIREVDPPRPSHRLGALPDSDRTSVAQHRGTDPARLLQLLRGDLDWIVMRCLEKDRSRRYETANGLAVDVERHLSDEPVVARPPSQIYRTRKFIRRHRLGVAATAAVAASVFAGLVTSSSLFVRERSARGRAVLAEQSESELRRQAEALGASEVKRAARTALDLANRNLADGRVADGLAYLVYAARKDPGNTTVAPRIASALSLHNFVLPQGTPFECGSRVLAVRFTKDGRSIFVGTEDGTFRVIDAASGELRQEFRLGRTVTLDGWEFPRDNEAVLGARFPDNTFGVYEIATGQPKFPPIQIDPRVWKYPAIIGVGRIDHAVGLSPDGRWIHARTGKELWAWDATTGEQRLHLAFDGQWISGPDFRADGAQLALTVGNSIRRWSLPDGTAMPESIAFEPSPSGAIGLYGTSVRFSPDGRRLVVCDPNVGLHVFDAATGAKLRTWPVSVNIYIPSSAVFAAADRVLLQGRNLSGSWDLATGKFTAVPIPSSDFLVDVCFDAAGTRGLAISSDGLVRIFDLATGEVLAEPTWQQHSDSQATLSPDGMQLVIGTLAGAVHRLKVGRSAARPLVLPNSERTPSAGQRMPALFLPEQPARLLHVLRDRAAVIDVASGREVPGGFPYPASIQAPYWSEFDYMVRSDLKFMVVRSQRGERQAWELGVDGIKQVVVLQDAPALPGQITFSPSGDMVAISAADAGVQVWNLRTGAPVAPAFVHLAPFLNTSTNFSPDGRHLAVGTVDGAAMILDIATSRPITTFKTRPLAPYPAARFSPDGTRLITANILNETQLWNVATGEPISPVTNIMGSRSARFSPDGRWLVATGISTTTLLDGLTGVAVGKPMPGGSYSRFSADSGLVGTSGRGPNTQVWEVPSGEPVTEPLPIPRSAILPEFSPDGRFLKTENRDLYLWSVPPRPVPGSTPPEWLLQLATICATKTVNEAGELADATAGSRNIEALRRQIEALPADAPYAEWGQWIMNDRADRSIAPGFTITPADADKLAAAVVPESADKP